MKNTGRINGILDVVFNLGVMVAMVFAFIVP